MQSAEKNIGNNRNILNMNILVRANGSAKTSTCVAELNNFDYLLFVAERSGAGKRVQTAGSRARNWQFGVTYPSS